MTAAQGRGGWVTAATIAVGLLGWALVIAAPELGVAPSPRTDLLSFAIFAAVILAIRALAFPIDDEHVVSLDASFYVAAALCLGATAAGRMVALALTLDAAARQWRDRRRGGRGEGWAYVVYFGGLGGGLLLAWAALVDVDGVGLAGASQGRIALAGLGLALGFLATHYAAQGARAWARGRSPRTYLRRIAGPGLAAEALVMPIGVVIALVYRPDELLGFALLCVTYVLLHGVWSGLRRASHDLAQRARELEILNATGRQLARALELERVVDAVARALPTAIDAADSVAVVHRGHDRATDHFVVDRFDRDADAFSRGRTGRDDGVIAPVLESGRVVAGEDLDPAGDRGPSVIAGARATLAAPIVLDGGPEGALVIASRRTAAFGVAERRVLEGMALQVAASLQNAHLYEMAMVDGLTGLFVRRYFDARIAEELVRGRREGTPFSVVMMDLDGFKQLNDTHGHQVGDRVLREAAVVVRDQMRGVDTAARYGGEEFAIVLPRTDKRAAYHLAERIRVALVGRAITVEGAASPLAITASFGISAFPDVPGDAADADEVVRRADRALYRAKQLGKDRVELFWVEEGQGAAAPLRREERARTGDVLAEADGG